MDSSKLEPQASQSRLGSIDSSTLSQPKNLSVDDLASWQGKNLLQSDGFAEITARHKRVEELMDRYAQNQGGGLSELITIILDDWVENSKIEGLMIATDDGLIVAENSHGNTDEHMASIAALFEEVVQRVQNGKIVDRVQELTLRGTRGELIIVRNFEGLSDRFYLLAYASAQVAYRMVTNRVLKEAGQLLSAHFEKHE